MEISKGGSSFSYHAILGLSSNSNNEEIKRAYRNMPEQYSHKFQRLARRPTDSAQKPTHNTANSLERKVETTERSR